MLVKSNKEKERDTSKPCSEGGRIETPKLWDLGILWIGTGLEFELLDEKYERK